jgi:hypothetical protein
MSVNWQCPYCQAHQVLSDATVSSKTSPYTLVENTKGEFGIGSIAIACANPQCREVTVRVWLAPTYKGHYGQVVRDINHAFFDKTLLPESSAKPQPDYIPKPLVDDYIEACRISELSPKASATLARRCLQGMIRDFCGISKARLIDEIDHLRKMVDAGQSPKGVLEESVDAIDHVRTIGNIGAHMERDINTIIDVDAGEARILIELIETLFKEWYVARHQRVKRLEGLKQIAEEKKLLRSPLKAIENKTDQE